MIHLPEVRLATLDDMERLVANTLAVAFESEATTLDPVTVQAAIEHGLRNQHGRWYVTEAASCMVTREYSDWRHGWYWWLQSVYVDSAHRRQGHWRALLTRVKEDAREADALGVRLLVRHDNDPALEAYFATGFEGMEYVTLHHRPS